METPDSHTDSGLAALYTRLRGSTAARDGLYVLAAQGTATAIALGMEILLFRNLLVAERGMLTAALELRNVLLCVADVGLALTTVRVGAEYFGKGLHNEANAVFRRAFLTRAALAALVVALTCLLAPALVRFPLAAGNRPGLVLAAAAALLGMTATAWGVDVSQATRGFGRYFLHQVVEAALKAAAVIVVFLAASGSLFGKTVVVLHAEIVLWVMAAGAILAGLFSVMLQRSNLRKPGPMAAATRDELYAQLRTFGRVAGAVVLLQAIGGRVEVFLVQWQLGPVDTAVFDGARRLALVLPLLGGALTTVLLPRVAVLDSPAACAAYAKKAVLICVPLALVAGAALAAVAGFIVPLLWGGRYEASITPLRWLCVAHAFSIVLAPLTLVFFPLRRERTFLLLQAASVVLSIGLGVVLIPRFGPLGAAWSTLVSRAAIVLVCGWVLCVILRDRGAPRPENAQ
ncbi:MAG: polysaccharide biosynthesis C-terminal domain-containing protein [Planctomycetota bacterium]|nr:polysaccharide biosynthesis C-terminal domain-containing protein [Planctomycetota bacterium]